MKLTLKQKQEQSILQKRSRREYESQQLLINSLKSNSVSSGVLKLKLLTSIQNELDELNPIQEYSDKFYEDFIKDCKDKDSKYIESKLKEINLI